jgi:hypothetical protein
VCREAASHPPLDPGDLPKGRPARIMRKGGFQVMPEYLLDTNALSIPRTTESAMKRYARWRRLHGRDISGQAEATRATQRAGIEHAKQRGDRACIGPKPNFTREQLTKVRDMLRQEAVGIAQVVRETGLLGNRAATAR